MGTGWSYFINICQTVRVLIGLIIALVGCTAAYVIFMLVTQQMQSVNQPPLIVAPPTGAAAIPANVSNPQFTPKISPVAPGAIPQQASPNGTGVNPQFAPQASPAGTTPAPTGPPGLIPGPPPNSTGRNPQFGR
jgi:hypothetical protein